MKGRRNRFIKKLLWCARTTLKRYSGPALGFTVLLIVLATLLRLWSSAGFREDEFGPKVVSSLSSFLIALVALWAGQGLKRRQEEAAHARAELALNVELIVRVLPHGEHIVLESEVRVKNVSNKTWNLPVVYVFVHPVDLSIIGSGASLADVTPPEVWKLRGTNIARFSNTMTRLSPDEEDVFARAYVLNEAAVRETPYYMVLVEVVGAPDSWEFDKEARDEFDRFMDGKSDPAGVAQARPIRDTYMIIETTEKGLREGGYGYGKRVLILPPERRKNDTQKDRIDDTPSKSYKNMLDKTMMWSRKRVVCLSPLALNGVEKGTEGRRPV
jgi:hypothetical protein